LLALTVPAKNNGGAAVRG